MDPTNTAGGHWSLANLTSQESSQLYLKAIIRNVTSGFPRARAVQERRELAGTSPEAVQGWCGQREDGMKLHPGGPAQQYTTQLTSEKNVSMLCSQQNFRETFYMA